MKVNQSIKKIISIVGTVLLSFELANALTVSPARAELTADPGETIQQMFTVVNELDTDQTYYTSVENFESQGEGGTPSFTNAKEGLASWVNVEEKVFIRKGEKVTIPYSVSVPKGADAGGHFAAIFLSTVPPSTGDGQVSVGAKVGMLVLLKVTGDLKENGGLIEFKIKDNKKVLSSIPLDFFYRFKNDGNDRVKPEGEIIIKNTLGMKVVSLDANKVAGNVLPGSVRRFEVRYGDKEAPAVSAPFFEHVSYQMDNFALGMYTASLSLTFGASGKALSSVTYFMFPWQLLTVVLVGLLIVVIVFIVLVKHYNRWIIRQARSHHSK